MGLGLLEGLVPCIRGARGRAVGFEYSVSSFGESSGVIGHGSTSMEEDVVDYCPENGADG